MGMRGRGCRTIYFMVRPEGESSNSLFEALENWNNCLEAHATCFEGHSQVRECSP